MKVQPLTNQIKHRPPTNVMTPKPGPKTQIKNKSYSYYTVRRKGEVHPSQVMAVDDPNDSAITSFLNRNAEWERCKITISPE
jgi:hypothetical protein